MSVLTQAGVHGWGSIHAPGCPQCPDTQHLCAPGVFTLLQSVEKQCTSPNAGKPVGDDKFSFPGCSAGKRSRVLPGEETGVWLAQPLLDCSSKCPSWGPPSSLGRGAGGQSSSGCRTLPPWLSSRAETGLTFCDPLLPALTQPCPHGGWPQPGVGQHEGKGSTDWQAFKEATS